jgi:hypothetical protein
LGDAILRPPLGGGWLLSTLICCRHEAGRCFVAVVVFLAPPVTRATKSANTPAAARPSRYFPAVDLDEILELT